MSGNRTVSMISYVRPTSGAILSLESARSNVDVIIARRRMNPSMRHRDASLSRAISAQIAGACLQQKKADLCCRRLRTRLCGRRVGDGICCGFELPCGWP